MGKLDGKMELVTGSARGLGRECARRLADPAEVAEAAVWLCTSAASYVHGHTLLADGGAVRG
jgi:NAD(P)-dependent dehydrogenase (short-subunit alcohol dehydrogenase family)